MEESVHPLNKNILFKKAKEEKDSGNTGFIVMFEDHLNYYTMHHSVKLSEDSYFNVRQDRFCATMDGVFKNQRNIWLERRPVRTAARIVFITFFDDYRLTKEYQSLYYHWWKTSRLTRSRHEYLAFTL
jgi:hypothetical protein